MTIRFRFAGTEGNKLDQLARLAVVDDGGIATGEVVRLPLSLTYAAFARVPGFDVGDRDRVFELKVEGGVPAS